MSGNNNEPLYEKDWGIVLILFIWPFYIPYLFLKELVGNNDPDPPTNYPSPTQQATFKLTLDDGTEIEAEIEELNLQFLINKWHGYFKDTYLPILTEQFEEHDLDERTMRRKFEHTVKFFYSNQETVEKNKSTDAVNALEIIAVDDERTCEHCRDHHGRVFPTDKAPTLPHHNCDNLKNDPQDWCRCFFGSVYKEDL